MHPIGRTPVLGLGSQTDFSTPYAPTTLLRTESRSVIVSITIHDTNLSHILVVLGATLNIMSQHTFEAMQLPISGSA
jgi:hypothetical protein